MTPLILATTISVFADSLLIEKERLRLDYRFSSGLTSVLPAVTVAQPPSSWVLFSRELPVDEMLDTHYHTSLKIQFGSSKARYCFSGQEEKPTGSSDDYGQLILFLTREESGKPDLTIDAQSIYRPTRRLKGKSFTLEGVSYEFKYVPRNFLRDPYRGDLYIEPESNGLPSYKIGIEEMIRTLYEKALAIPSAPFKIALFSKYNNQKEYWILVMTNTKEENYQNYRRFHVDPRELPVNAEGQEPLKVISRTFENHIFYLAFIQRSGRLYLYLRIDK